MNYQETIDYLYSALPVFQRDGKSAFKKDLKNIQELCKVLGNPQDSFQSIHVAGTNGKGSVAHILSATLQVAGHQVGLYTSPHLRDFRERIRINGECVPEEFVISFVETIKTAILKISPSFFEITVAMAFAYFREKKVDYAVIETGLGGRLDSTNIINPIVSVITSIGLDHTDMLGNTLVEIAREKAGIIKSETPVVLGEIPGECIAVFEEKARALQAPLIKSWQVPMTLEFNPSDLRGAYQAKNLALSRVVVQTLIKNKHDVNINIWRKAIQNVKGLTGLRGRWDVLQEKNPKIICDTGHNKDGLEMVVKSLESESYDMLHMVLGVVKEKDLSLLAILPKSAKYYFCKPSIFRGLDEKILKTEANKLGLIGESFRSVHEALESAKSEAKPKDLILIGGSTFVVAEVI